MAPLKSSENRVEIYTDGSCDPNPGPGGWAAIILDGNEKRSLKDTPKNPQTTVWS